MQPSHDGDNDDDVGDGDDEVVSWFFAVFGWLPWFFK